MLLAGFHVLQRHAALADLVVAGQRYVGYLLGVGIRHLLLHLGAVGIKLGGYAVGAYLINYRQTVGCLALAEVDEQQACTADAVLRIEVQLVEHVVDAVGTEGDAYARQSWHAEDARQVVVASTARDGAYLHVEGLDLEDGAGVVVQSAGQREVELQLVAQEGGSFGR